MAAYTYSQQRQRLALLQQEQKSLEAEIVEKYNKTIFSVLVHKNELILKAFADSKIGGIEIVAQK